MRSKITVNVPDTRKEPAYVDSRGIDWTGPPTTLSELAVPVLVDNRVLAVLNAERKKSNAFTAEDQKLLETLALHAASSLGQLAAAEKLQKSEEAYRALVENALHGLAVFQDNR